MAALQRLREHRFFDGWDDFIDREHVEASEASIRRLVADLMALGPQPAEEAVRRAVNQCVRRFNDLDDGWICTTERDDIYVVVARIVELCGFVCEERWLDERVW